MNQSVPRRHGRGGFFGHSLGGFGLLTSVLLLAATAFLTFFLATFLAIVALLFWNLLGGHSVNYADTYLYVGLPAGVLALVVATIVFVTAWIRSKLH